MSEFLICGNPAVLEKLDLSHMNPYGRSKTLVSIISSFTCCARKQNGFNRCLPKDQKAVCSNPTHDKMQCLIFDNLFFFSFFFFVCVCVSVCDKKQKNKQQGIYFIYLICLFICSLSGLNLFLLPRVVFLLHRYITSIRRTCVRFHNVIRQTATTTV